MNKERLASIAELLIPVIESIKESGGAAENDQIAAQLAEHGYPNAGKSVDGYRTKLEDRVAWAKTYLKNFGALNNPKTGVWALTDMGKRVKDGDEAQIMEVNYKRYGRKPLPVVVPKREQRNAHAVVRAFPETKIITPVKDDNDSAYNEAKTIVNLVNKGIISPEAANKALLELIGDKRNAGK